MSRTLLAIVLACTIGTLLFKIFDSLLGALIGMLPVSARVKTAEEHARKICSLPLPEAIDASRQALTSSPYVKTFPRVLPENPLESALPPMVRDVLRRFDELEFSDAHARIGVRELKLLDGHAIAIGWSEDEGTYFVRGNSEEIYSTFGDINDGRLVAPTIHHVIILLGGDEIFEEHGSSGRDSSSRC